MHEIVAQHCHHASFFSSEISPLLLVVSIGKSIHFHIWKCTDIVTNSESQDWSCLQYLALESSGILQESVGDNKDLFQIAR